VAWFTMWLLLWKMKATSLKLWLQHWTFETFFKFMKIFALGMWCLKYVNMWQMLTRLMWVWIWYIWKMFKLICKK
jgi:hypothetical protein